MSQRLQVLLPAQEYKQFRKVSKEQGLSLGEWVRVTLRQAVSRLSSQPADKKLEAIRKASRFSYPSGDIDQMLSEIEKGYLS
ncbi:MAG: antitoxin [Deltaproteobacteria bacterium]|nr:MAG: antitoxin [Deltaproteobacteria bacterium]